ncbi:MAG: hypothetical protein ACI90V_013553, partial [Bacillariaceae sp.]
WIKENNNSNIWRTLLNNECIKNMLLMDGYDCRIQRNVMARK